MPAVVVVDTFVAAVVASRAYRACRAHRRAYRAPRAVVPAFFIVAGRIDSNRIPESHNRVVFLRNFFRITGFPWGF